jgi:pimeloyl-ACP methyl ester carboxylesterase
MAAARTAGQLSGPTVHGEQPPAHVEVRGDGDPVLFLHGWGTSASLFEPVLGGLATDRRLILPDLPGFGETPEPPQPWGVDEYAAWTLALLDRLSVQRCDIVAHSNGARVALVLAALHPDRVHRLVLTGAAGLRRRRTLRGVLSVRTYKTLRWISRSALVPQSVRRRATARADRRGSDDYRAAGGVMRGTLVRLVNRDLRPLLPRINAPTLLIWGSRDDAVPLSDAREMERSIPDCGLVVFEGSGHYAYLEQAVRFVHIVDVFLVRSV